MSTRPAARRGGAAAIAITLLLAAGVGAGAYFLGHSVATTSTRTVTIGANGLPVGPTTIAKAPSFSSSDLTAQPTDNWITNGGTTFNQRYSPLDEINSDNVKDLKGVWRTH